MIFQKIIVNLIDLRIYDNSFGRILLKDTKNYHGYNYIRTSKVVFFLKSRFNLRKSENDFVQHVTLSIKKNLINLSLRNNYYKNEKEKYVFRKNKIFV